MAFPPGIIEIAAGYVTKAKPKPDALTSPIPMFKACIRKPTMLNTAKPAKKLVAQLENEVIKALLVTSALLAMKLP